MADKVRVLVVGLGNMGNVPCQRLSPQPRFRDRRHHEPLDQVETPSGRTQGLPAVRRFRHGAGGHQARCGVDQFVAEHPCRIRHQGDERRRACVHGKADCNDHRGRRSGRRPGAREEHASWCSATSCASIRAGSSSSSSARRWASRWSMRLNLNQQSNGPAWNWHKNLIDSLIPIVDCGVHYVDVMCQLTGAKPVRVHGIGAALWDDATKPNYGHLHVTFDDGSVGWYEAGWGPMMSEVAVFVKDVVGPKGAVSIVPRHSKVKRATLGARRTPTGTPRQTPSSITMPRSAPAQELPQEGRVVHPGGRTRPPGSLRPRAGLLPQGDPRRSRPHESMDAAVNSLRIVLAAEQSINEGRVVELA